MKRLIVACDGTWLNSDNGFVRDSWLPWKSGGHLAIPSNVTRICRALLPRSHDGVPQIVYYQAGLGSLGNWYSFLIGGFLGEGISENIREAYAFLCKNYEAGDEIFLIGFSRGAFTARSIGGLITDVGLLTTKGLEAFYPIFKDWENQADPHYQPKYGSSTWPVTRPKFSDSGYVPTLVKAGLTRSNIPIKAIGVWDTVGTLGVPEMSLLGIKLFSSTRREYSFINTNVGTNVEFAYQALALDEQRKDFVPAVWESPKPGTPSKLKSLRQCWFPGVHASIGGGWSADTDLSDISLAWMMAQLQPLLDFDSGYILSQQRQNEQFYSDQHIPSRGWGMGTIKRSDAGLLNTLTGRQVRTPGEYYATDPSTNKQSNRKLFQTCEYMHPCVRYRIDERGPGLSKSWQEQGQGIYSPSPLKQWKYVRPARSFADGGIDVGDEESEPVACGTWVKQGGEVSITEEAIRKDNAEGELLAAWPKIEQTILH